MREGCARHGGQLCSPLCNLHSDAPAFSPVAEMFSYASWKKTVSAQGMRIELTASQTHVGKVLSILAVLCKLLGCVPLGDLFALGDLLLEPGLPACLEGRRLVDGGECAHLRTPRTQAAPSRR